MGRVYRRCKGHGFTIPPGERRCRAGCDRYSWAFAVDVALSGSPKREVAVKTGFATKADAERAMRERRDRAEARQPEPTNITVGNWLEQWLPSIRGRVRPSTLTSYELAIRRHLVPRIGHVHLRLLTRAQVRSAYADLEQGGLSPKTVHNTHMTLRKALADALEEGLLVRNPADRAHRLPPGRAEMRVWNGVQVAAFLGYVADDRLAAFWRLAVTTGMRRGELLALRWKDVHIDDRFLSVERAYVRGESGWVIGSPKTAAGRRRVQLSAEMVDALVDHRARQIVVGVDGLVFDRGDGQPLDPDGVTGMFERLSRLAGLPRIRLHDLRHTAASLMLAAGVNPKVVQERLGHSSVTITLDTYSHLVPTLQEDAAERLERAISG